MSKVKRFTIGTDPEFFLKKEGKYISAIPHVVGTKYEPVKMPCGATIQRDNVAVEFATVPAKSREEFVENVRAAIKDTMKVIPKDFDLVVEPSAIFSEDQLDNPEACEFGCEPDYNAWKLEMNEKPYPGESGFRSCGAHIHVGALDEKGKPLPGLRFLLSPHGKCDMVKVMDLFHGIISVVLDNSEASVKRRSLYGKAGCHRPTEYGVEYRVLSNYWMKSPELVMLMDSLTADAIRLISEKKHTKLIELIGEDVICETINKGNVTQAKEIIKKFVFAELSNDTKDYLKLAAEKVKEAKDIKKEWTL